MGTPSLADAGRRAASAMILLVTTTGLALTACGGGKTPTSPTQPTSSAQTGAVRIVTTTTGKTLDPDGYSATVDGGSGVSVGINDTVRVTGLAAGVHQVELSGIASNCSVGADDPLGVTVTAGDTTDAAFDVSCELALRNQIVFTSTRNAGDAEIYVVNADGSYQTRLTTSPHLDLDARPSPDGTRIAFTSTRDGNPEIYVMQADGSNPTRLTDNAVDDEAPTWSPDGTKIVFVSARSGCCRLFEMNADGSKVTQITPDTLPASSPDWSPDGSTVVFGGPHADIYAIKPDGTDLRNLTNDSNHTEENPVVSPDGSMIAFDSDSTGDDEVWVMNADGSQPTQVTHNPATDAYPSWSPDGSRLTFESNRSGVYDVYAINLDGTGLIDLTNDAAVDEVPFWSRE